MLEASSAHKGRTGRNHLRIICAAAGLPDSRADEVLELTGLTPAAKRKFKGYSLGMRQRLGIAAAMIGDPQVLILDEPANGLDPEGIKWMRELLKSLADQGRTILVSSHLLSEMELLADDVVIVAAGKLVRQGTVEQIIKSSQTGVVVQVRTPNADALRGAVIERGGQIVAGHRRPAHRDRPGSGGGRQCRVHRRRRIARTHHRSPRPRGRLPGAHARKGGHPMTSDTMPTISRPTQPQLLRQLRSERIKLSSTKTWWLFGIGTTVMTGLALLINCLTVHDDLSNTARAQRIWSPTAANVFTSGQYFGGLFVMLLAILMITNEFYHQTATTTFLATPRRTEVIVGKFVMAMIAAALAWLLTTVIDIVVGVLYFKSRRHLERARHIGCDPGDADQPDGLRAVGRSSASASAR